MNFRPFTVPALLTLLLAGPARARIVVDDNAPEQPAESAIHVPGPGDTTNGINPATQETVSFLNKDQLHGTLLSIDDSTGVHWQSLEAHDPIVFKTDQVAEIKLDAQRPANAPVSAERIGLTNGDELPGNIVSLDGNTLVLDTWYAERLSIPRSMLRSIVPLSQANSVLYEGPTGMDGWSAGRMGIGRSWSFHDGALIGTNYGTIGRDVKLPDTSSVEFDLVLRGNSQFSIGIYSDQTVNFGNCYMLTLSAGYIEMQRFSRTGGSSDLGSAQMQNVMRNDKSHIEIRTNKDKKSIWLLIDGKIIKEWSDPAEFNGGGGGIIFSCQPGTYVRLTDIKVSKWDGKFDETANPDAQSDEDAVQLANEDRVSGHLEAIQDGKAKLSSAYAELSIPLDRIDEVDFATAHADQAKPDPSDVRAYFPEGGSITMQLNQWDTKGSTGSSPNFGKAIFSSGAFARILFNLPAQQQNQDADDSGSDNDNPDPGEKD